jgi:hypothetical protein
MKDGKIKKVAELDKVLQICNTHGASYNPGNDALQPTALSSLLEQAQEKVKAVIVARAAYSLAVNNRQKSFAGIPKLAGQVVSMLESSKASSEDKEEAKMIKRTLSPVSRTKKGDNSQAQSGNGTQAEKNRSRSQLDRDGMLNNFHRLVQLVAQIPAYNPREPELAVETLHAMLASFQLHHKWAREAAIQYSNARIARDGILYGPEGVVEVTKQVKAYLRGKFGYRSPQAVQTRTSMNF